MGDTVCCGVVFVYIAAWRCIRDPLMAAPVLFCGIASMASLAVKLRPFKVHAHTRAITLLVSIGVTALIYATTRVESMDLRY